MQYPFEIIEKEESQIAGMPASIRVRLEDAETLNITVYDVENQQKYTYVRRGDVVSRNDNDNDNEHENDNDNDSSVQPICALKIPVGALNHIFTARFILYVHRYSKQSFADIAASIKKKKVTGTTNLDADLSI